jgi:hypothetical protein
MGHDNKNDGNAQMAAPFANTLARRNGTMADRNVQTFAETIFNTRGPPITTPAVLFWQRGAPANVVATAHSANATKVFRLCYGQLRSECSMSKPTLAVVEWMGLVPATAVCSGCGLEFVLPASELCSVQQATRSLYSQFHEHRCTNRNGNSGGGRIAAQNTNSPPRRDAGS